MRSLLLVLCLCALPFALNGFIHKFKNKLAPQTASLTLDEQRVVTPVKVYLEQRIPQYGLKLEQRAIEQPQGPSLLTKVGGLLETFKRKFHKGGYAQAASYAYVPSYAHVAVAQQPVYVREEPQPQPLPPQQVQFVQLEPQPEPLPPPPQPAVIVPVQQPEPPKKARVCFDVDVNALQQQQQQHLYSQNSWTQGAGGLNYAITQPQQQQQQPLYLSLQAGGQTGGVKDFFNKIKAHFHGEQSSVQSPVIVQPYAVDNQDKSVFYTSASTSNHNYIHSRSADVADDSQSSDKTSAEEKKSSS